MKAAENTFLTLLEGKKQFIIPIYQRSYSWTLKQCDQLWKDILRAATDKDVNGHFIGSIVYIQDGLFVAAAIPKMLVIDGQQRLTTISLLLLALAQVAAQTSTSGTTRDEIFESYLINKFGNGDEHYKLLLRQSDKHTLTRLIDELDWPEHSSQHILENYQFFKEQIQRSGIDLNALYIGIKKLITVEISLDRSHDNPQLIFESLNSTGLDLSQADQIRNYVLMGLEDAEQTKLYEAYWRPMEQSFDDTKDPAIFDRFMRDYLTIKSSGTIPNIDEVYEKFKQYRLREQASSISEIVADIYRYSKHFTKLAFQREEDPEIRRVLTDINTLRADVTYPFLIEVYDDYVNHLLERGDLLAILRLVESYVFRRAICGVPTNSMNKTFATLSREIDKSHYLESVQVALLLKETYRRFPGDEEFRAEFMVKDVYNFRNRNYLLRKLENYGQKEQVDVEVYTIEHILPQNPNLSPEWQQELGPEWKEVQSKYLHTIGNLTLTGYNPELSDQPFHKKRDMKDGGFAHSPIRLNQSLATLEHWNQEEIENRAKMLADLAVQIWQIPSASPDVLARSAKTEIASGGKVYTLADHAQYLQGDLLTHFEQLRKRILNLDPSVREEVKKLYIAYKTTTNFVDIVPQKNRLRLSLNMKFDEIIDPKGLTKDVTDLGRWGNGDVEVGLSSPDQLEDVMYLIRQSFEKHREDDE